MTTKGKSGARMRVSEWHGCYDQQWRDLIVPDAFAHPAKFAPGLIDRILKHGLAQGYWRKGQILGDPFGGICGGGIMAAYNGLGWVGVELEPRFVELGNRNIDMHRATWQAHGYPVPILVQGDSRRFSEIVGGISSICTSPPYAECLSSEKKENISSKIKVAKATGKTAARSTWGENCRSNGWSGCAYSSDPSNIGNLRSGTLAGIATSPPWEQSLTSKDDNFNSIARPGRTDQKSEYGKSQGQIGNEKSESYWDACSQVYFECWKALKPGGYMAIVVKAYVKNKRRVPLPMQTLKLLIRLGFEPVERVKAVLVKKDEHPGLFGETITKTKQRKSFFRLLAEKNGSPKIDWEEVLFVRKPE